MASNLGSDGRVPHPGGLGASSGWYGCLERKKTKILNESPLTGLRADKRDTWSDGVCCSTAASDEGKKAVIYFLAGPMGLVISENYYNQTNSKCSCSASKNPFHF